MPLGDRPGVRSYRDLLVWQRAMELSRETDRLTETFPRHETYGIISQMRRAALSIAANIAEGHSRPTTADYLRFIGIARASLKELECYFDSSKNRGYLRPEDLVRSDLLADETGKMLTALSHALRKKRRDR